jgi:hypothetical protein
MKAHQHSNPKIRGEFQGEGEQLNARLITIATSVYYSFLGLFARSLRGGVGGSKRVFGTSPGDKELRPLNLKREARNISS